jgi:hypothetical protein
VLSRRKPVLCRNGDGSVRHSSTSR